MSGSGRRGGRGRGRGGRGGGGGSGGAPGMQNPVEFNLYASPQFDMSGCPAIVKPANAPGALYRLAMPDRQVLGDIVLWFAAAAVAEPTSTLVMWQATKQDKSWLSGYVEQSVNQLEVGMYEVGSSQKYMQFKLRTGLVPPPPPPSGAEPSAAAAAPQPAAVPSSNGGVPSPVSSPPEQRKQPSPAPAADKHPQEQQKSGAGAAEQAGKAAMAKAEAAGKAAQAAVASAGQAAKDAAHSVGNKVASTAAAAKEGLSGAKQQLHGATDAASDKAACNGDGGPGAQKVAIAGAAAATVVAALGIAIGVLARRRHKA